METCQVSIVEDDVVGLLHHLDGGHLSCQAMPDFVLVLTAVTEQSGDHGILRCGHDPQPVYHVEPAGLDQERGFEHRPGVIVGTQPGEAPHHALARGGMDDSVQAHTRCRI